MDGHLVDLAVGRTHHELAGRNPDHLIRPRKVIHRGGLLGLDFVMRFLCLGNIF